ncbi:MAG: hypothetical protein Q4D91_00755 [Lautropia sp.]|nr:hypothetical protein [Lautropia sp.]
MSTPSPERPFSELRRRHLRRLSSSAVALPALALTGTPPNAAPPPEHLQRLDSMVLAQNGKPFGHEPHVNGWGSGTVPFDNTDRRFRFGFIGDTPYNRLDQYGLSQVMKGLDETDLEFVLHVGDIKGRSEACSDTLLCDRLETLDRSRHPLILTPGDNEWTDCFNRKTDDPFAPGAPLDRLHWLRKQIYHHPESMGQRRIQVEQQRQMITQLSVRDSNQIEQPRLPENLRWRIGSLQFCTIHVVGSNNGMAYTAELRQAWALRQQANAIWLTETALLAKRYGAKGLVIATHANMRFEQDNNDGWTSTRQAIISAATDFDGPVALLHGDTHIFRTDRLLLKSHGLDRFIRVECFGSPFSWQWVTIRWNPEAATLAKPDPDIGPAFQVYTHHA